MKGVYMVRHWSIERWIIICAILMGLALVPWLTKAQSSQPAGDTKDGRYVFADLAERVIPSVVTVYVKRDLKKELSPEQLNKLEQYRRFFEDPQMRQFFSPFSPGPQQSPQMPSPGQPGQEEEENDFMIQKGSGSGVIISEDGYILTNWHVVGNKKDQAEIRVVLSDDTELSGKDVQLIDSSPLIDLALLKVNRKGLHPLQWGNSDTLRIGERVSAIGSPLDLRLTITQGIISAKHREVGMGLGDMLQTDAVINPGSSGGPLVNLDGQLIGINRMIATPSQSGRWEGYGFAIPSNDAKYFANEVMTKGRVSYGYIGVMMASELQDTGKMREAIGLGKDQKGVLVMGVNPDTPAAKAGLQEGDLITAADGTKIEDSGDLLGYVARRGIGSTIKFTVLRAGESKTPKEMTVKVTVAERPSEDNLLPGQKKSPEKESPKLDELGKNALGLVVEPYDKEGTQGLQITSIRPNSAAARAGLQEGDVLLKLNRMALKSPADLNKAVQGHPQGRPHLLQFMREGRTLLTPLDEK